MTKAASISWRLLRLVLGILTVVLLVLGFYSFMKSDKELQELADGRLAQNARTLQVLIENGADASLANNGRHRIIVPSSSDVPNVRTYQAEVGFQVYDQSGDLLLSTMNLAALPPVRAGEVGYTNVQQDHHRWRLFTQPADASHLIIRTGERNDSRRDIVRALWIEHGAPLLFVLPLLAVLMRWAIKHGLSPLQQLADLLSKREPGSRAPVQLDKPPRELQPVVEALNAQLKALEDALERERRFSADVAHELRTPISSAMVNIDNAEATLDGGDARKAMDGARDSLAKLARRVEQLLALARIESAAGDMRPVDLVTLAGNVIEELASTIASSNVDMSVGFCAEHVWVQGHEAALGALLRNLIENALRHIPSGGQVQVAISEDGAGALIDVIDDGEGIPLERREAVFARFHREAGSLGEGYGLGLSIVQRAARLHNANVELLDSPFGRGLRVQVRIPQQRV
ncbi:two-component sensor histidine kinase [Dyella monticola]|uniref:histidine kinase n=1 Tax=Dyella monticola TaxID=1927958 RepID=A0A370WZS5_9GAMM|nr:ATP-binding protein [Dyella monticola]RDS81606.1 two-component sensor histidine kinase [Dyella monticola]